MKAYYTSTATLKHFRGGNTKKFARQEGNKKARIAAKAYVKALYETNGEVEAPTQIGSVNCD